jgi:hypothetical protein
MLYIRILFLMFIVLYVIYYILVIGHLFGLWKLTNETMKFSKVIIPFYYFTKL